MVFSNLIWGTLLFAKKISDFLNPHPSPNFFLNVTRIFPNEYSLTEDSLIKFSQKYDIHQAWFLEYVYSLIVFQFPDYSLNATIFIHEITRCILIK